MKRLSLWVLLLSLGSSGCSLLLIGRPQYAAEPVEISDAGVSITRERQAELVVTLHNNAEHTLWARVRFQTPHRTGDCLVSKELAAGEQGIYLCQLSQIPAAGNYPLTVTVFATIEQQTPIAELLSVISLETADSEHLRALMKPGSK